MVAEEPSAARAIEPLINRLIGYIGHLQNWMGGLLLHTFEVPEGSGQAEDEVGHVEDECEDPDSADEEEDGHDFALGGELEVAVGQVLVAVGERPGADNESGKEFGVRAQKGSTGIRGSRR